MFLNGKALGITPIEVAIPYRPFFMEAPVLSLKLQPGYRTMRLNLRRESGGAQILWNTLRHPGVALGLSPAPIYQIQLMPRHGPIGTWGIAGD